jgi:hypothetical protein
MPGVKNFLVINASEEVEIPNSKNSREQALPGKPSFFFY